MYLRTGSNVADLSLHKDGRIDCFEGFDRFFGLAHVLLEWQRGKIEDDGIKPSPGRFYRLRQGMGMIRVKKDWAVAFLPQTPHQSRNLPDSDKLPFALGRPTTTGTFSSCPDANTAFNRTQSATLK